MPDGNDFRAALKGKKIPVLTLDEKWHKLFALGGKTDAVISLEAELNALLQKQGKLAAEQRQLKKQKNRLMANVVENMEGTYEENKNKKSSKRLDADKKELDEVNERLRRLEDELLDLPREMNRVNGELMLETMEFCYGRLRQNYNEVQEIKSWIDEVRVELKKKLIRKQNREISNRQIYTYMHDIFGPQALDIFDLYYTEKNEAAPEDAENAKSEADGQEEKDGSDSAAVEKNKKEDKVTVKSRGRNRKKEKPVENFRTADTGAGPDKPHG